MRHVQRYMKTETLPHGFDPSLFDLSPSNCDRVRSLLLQLQSNQVQDEGEPAEWIEMLTNVLFEVLQHVGIISGPKSDQQVECEQLSNIVSAL